MRRAIAGIAAAVLSLTSQVLVEPPTQLPESRPLRIVAWYSVPAEQSTVERLPLFVVNLHSGTVGEHTAPHRLNWKT
jgi:hypothetical protein